MTSGALPNYDATFCGKLPLHQTNLIQPHGYLFVLDAQSLEVLQVSDNLQTLTGVPVSALTGSSFDQLADETTVVQLRTIAGSGAAGKQPIQVGMHVQATDIQFSGLVHVLDRQLFLELLNPTLAAPQGKSFLEVYQDIKRLMQEMQQGATIAAFAALAASGLKQFTGFDKVMVYSFDAEWNGTVIAEAQEPGMDPYMDLRFPASDIPAPARALYLKNPYRLIPNSSYQPARLYPMLNPRTHTLTDLTGCDLRSVAAVHLEYLRNMGVTASLSLRLVHNGALWGLISCHHRSPRYFSFETMGVFELLSDVLSAQLSILLNQAHAERQSGLQQKLTQLVPHLHNDGNLENGFSNHAAEVQELLGATGIAYNVNGHIQAQGAVPKAEDLNRLFYWLQVQEPRELVHQPALPQVFEEAASFASVGSGMLALPVVPAKGQFVVAFRPETVEEVKWGGNPHDALRMGEDGKSYHPRNSFAVWKQIVRHTAKPWSAEELDVAEAFRNVLTGIALRHLHA